MLEPEDNLSMNNKSNSLNKLFTVKNQEQTDQIEKTYLKAFLIFRFITKPSMKNK